MNLKRVMVLLFPLFDHGARPFSVPPQPLWGPTIRLTLRGRVAVAAGQRPGTCFWPIGWQRHSLVGSSSGPQSVRTRSRPHPVSPLVPGASPSSASPRSIAAMSGPIASMSWNRRFHRSDAFDDSGRAAGTSNGQPHDERHDLALGIHRRRAAATVSEVRPNFRGSGRSRPECARAS